MEVSENPSKWDLHRFFTGLFNHCFPVDFRLQQLSRLRDARQGNKAVKAFVHELKTLYLMAGVVSEPEKVLKLWYGLNTSLQRELWRFGFTPTHSSWGEIVEAAVRFELSAAAARLGGGGGGGGGGDDHDPSGSGGRGGGGGGGQRRRDRRNSRSRGQPPSGAGGSHSRSSHQPARSAPASGAPRADARRPKLSDRERAELQAAGKCFVCREPGHLSRNCPRANSARSSRSGRPPGVTINTIDVAGTEQLRALMDATPSIDELQLNAAYLGGESGSSDSEEVARLLEDLSLDDSGEESEDPPLSALIDWDEAARCPPVELPVIAREGRLYRPVADPYGDHAAQVLLRHVPYCCSDVVRQQLDTGAEDEVQVPLCIYRVEGDRYLIMGRDPVPDIFVPGPWLRNPEFNLPRWYKYEVSRALGHRACRRKIPGEQLGDALALCLEHTLEREIPYPDAWRAYMGARLTARRFHCFTRPSEPDDILVWDGYLFTESAIARSAMGNPRFDAANAYATSIRRAFDGDAFGIADLDGSELPGLFSGITSERLEGVECFMARAKEPRDDVVPALQRNASAAKDFKRKVPQPIVVVVNVNGQPARALIDTGSSADFISSKLVRQLGIKPVELTKQIPLLLAVQGSKGKISTGCMAQLQYQGITGPRYFDVINLLNYDLILGTPFLYQHQISVGFNPSTVVVGSTTPRPLVGSGVDCLESRAADLYEDSLELARQYLRDYALPIASTDASATPLPPLRAINHQIPLKEPGKLIPWRPSKCPDALRSLWAAKRDAYLKTGRWKMSNARCTSPMLLLTKPGTGIRGIPPRLRCVFDLRERNKNTEKLSSPLPDMDGILRRVSRKRFRSSMDGKDAYECIRIDPDHVDRAAMTTPDGNMVSLVLQQGDCNAVATYQNLMNHLFAPYIGVFMDVYLDDILIYSDSLEDHIAHVKIIVDILKREQLYLNADKLKFLCSELKILGRIVDDHGIRMDPDKVDSVVNWKVPTNKELLRGFLGSVGYLADDVGLVRIPMGVLTELTAVDRCFKWEPTHQRAFDEIKHLVQTHRDH
ncbi:polyprotein, partial [Phanerochaete sordida]